MNPDDNLFAGASVWIASSAPADAWCAFASRFGAGQVQLVPARQSGPDPDLFARLAGHLATADLDGVVLFSAAGAQRLVESAASLPDPERFMGALADSRILVAGPRAARVLQRRGISAHVTLPEANNWRLAVAGLEKQADLAQSRLAAESTAHDISLRAALESRGVDVRFILLAAAPRAAVPAPAASDPASSAIILLVDLEGLAGLTAADCPLAAAGSSAARVFTSDSDLFELANVLGFDARLVSTRRPIEGWAAEEAWQIAAQSW